MSTKKKPSPDSIVREIKRKTRRKFSLNIWEIFEWPLKIKNKPKFSSSVWSLGPRKGKMNDKPKDRTTIWMTIIALILVLMIVFVLGVGIYWIATNYYTTPIVGFLLYSVFLAIVLRWIMREKRIYKPKDRKTVWMSIIALILALIISLSVAIYVRVIGGGGIGGVFSLLCLVFLAVALHWKAVGGIFFVILGLPFVYLGITNIIAGEYETLSGGIFGLVWDGLMPIILGLLFLAIWRKTRKSEIPTSSD